MANIASTMVLVNAAAAKLDDALAVLEEASNQLDISSRSEDEQNLFFELGTLLEGFEKLQADANDVVETYSDD